MKVFSSIPAWNVYREEMGLRHEISLGLVPTMGALHAGHLSLVAQSRRDNVCTVVSIFINPTQFNQAEDLARYPRTHEADLAKLESAGVDAVFMPDYDSLYPDAYTYRVSESAFSEWLCGAHRPGHFDGVLTVVTKLFNIIRPTRAYFGEKDYQQLQLVRGMVAAFFMPVEIIACPTVRETDGLAMSSRNQRLGGQDRLRASGFYRTLRTADDADSARERLEDLGFDVDYVEDWQGRRLGAVHLAGVRLIDNVPIHPEITGKR